jgi:ABC-type transport system involved in Fe-S cluster assembly fused permease/ATPase subunit
MHLWVLKMLTLLFTALALAPASAHLLELPNKFTLSRNEYSISQRLYRGWNFVGVVVVAALLSTLALAIAVRPRAEQFTAAIVAFACVAATLLIFWFFTYPVNKKTVNWTRMPDDWTRLRLRWEYCHAASAVLNLAAFIATSVAVTWE